MIRYKITNKYYKTKNSRRYKFSYEILPLFGICFFYYLYLIIIRAI